jgi:threonine synthase
MCCHGRYSIGVKNMRLGDLALADQALVWPSPGGNMNYRCLVCSRSNDIHRLLYTCPHCGGVLLIDSQEPAPLTPQQWRRRFDLRKLLTAPPLRGIFRYHELIAPILPLDSLIYLGEGHTPMIEASPGLAQTAGLNLAFKNDGQNPSASFKDRGMAGAMSYINYLIKHQNVGPVLSVCASTGDTSASAALYASYLAPQVLSAVLLPAGKVTPQQLAQPLGSGAFVFEIPGVFDDCMKVVEYLAEHYQVALLNSKNAWRIRGQESYAYEIAQDLDYDLTDQVVVVPIGNAGNVSAIMAGFLRLRALGIINTLPGIIGVQSEHADPVFRYYQQPRPRRFAPVTVRPSTAQAAMIGNPVSMPRVIELAGQYQESGGQFALVQVSEQEIMDNMLTANRHGHIACTQGGESLAGLRRARELKLVSKNQHAIVDSTAHHLKFIGFQQMYFDNAFPPEFEIIPNLELANQPRPITVPGPCPQAGRPLHGEEFSNFVGQTARAVAERLGLKTREKGPKA